MGRLIDADALKNHYAWWEGGTKENTLDESRKIFDDIIDVQPTAKPEWISVEDDTPIYGEPVLAVMYVPITVLGARIVGRSIGIAVCEYDGEAERERWFCGEKEVEVTHWMPQPPFPEE